MGGKKENRAGLRLIPPPMLCFPTNLIQNLPRRLNSFPNTHHTPCSLILELIHTLINIQKVLFLFCSVLLNVCCWQKREPFLCCCYSLCQRNLLAAFLVLIITPRSYFLFPLSWVPSDSHNIPISWESGRTSVGNMNTTNRGS